MGITSTLRAVSNRFGLGFIHVGALAVFLPTMWHWQAAVAGAIVLYLTGALGVTLCYHRTLTHRSLKLVKPLEYLFAIFGTLALQGDPIRWVATHRKHHAHADGEGDPHGIDRGFRWAHIRWLYKPNDAIPTTEELHKYAPDLWKDPFYRALRTIHGPMQLLLGVGLFLLGGWAFVVWGIFVRLVVSYHSTWFVNSAAHSLGYRTYQTEDQSTNCWWVALLSYGEGWHNNHHAFPFSARHGLRWFEFDPTWWNVRVLKFLRLASQVKVPLTVSQQRLRENRAS